MNLSDLFLRELEKDTGVSDVVRKLGQMLAEQHKSALETTAEFARRQCEMYRLGEDVVAERRVKDDAMKAVLTRKSAASG